MSETDEDNEDRYIDESLSRTGEGVIRQENEVKVARDEEIKLQMDSLLKAETSHRAIRRSKAKRSISGEMGPDIVLQVYLTPYGQRLARYGMIRRFTKTNIWRIISNAVYIPIRFSIQAQIWILAPADTKRLRKSLVASISPAYTYTHLEIPFLTDPNIKFTVSLGTPGIYYARHVNDMPTRWLRHPSSHHKNRGRTGRFLFDPFAETNWYDKILIIGRNTAKQRWSVFRRRMIRILGGGTIGAREFANSFQVNFK